MADETKAGGLPSAVKELLAKASGLLGIDEKTEEAAKNPGGLADQISAASAGYKTTIKWILGAFVAVGVLLFGTLPFAGIADVDEMGTLWRAIAGLAAAGAGIAVAIWATSMALEPEDASLGELALAFEGLGNTHIDPRKRSIAQLKAMYDAEHAAHLGPDITSISDLINKLGVLDRNYLEHSELVKVAAGKLAASSAAAEAAAGSLAEIGALLKESDPEKHPEVAEVLREAAVARIQAAETAAAQRDADFIGLRDQSDGLAATVSKLDVYLFHRELIMREFVMAQLRGTFHYARYLITGAALLVLFGGLLYATALVTEKKEEDKPATAATATIYPTRVTVTVNSKAKVWPQLPEPCRTGALTAWLYSDKPFDEAGHDGPASIVVIGPEACVGQKLDLAEDEAEIKTP